MRQKQHKTHFNMSKKSILSHDQNNMSTIAEEKEI